MITKDEVIDAVSFAIRRMVKPEHLKDYQEIEDFDWHCRRLDVEDLYGSVDEAPLMSEVLLHEGAELEEGEWECICEQLYCEAMEKRKWRSTKKMLEIQKELLDGRR